MADASDRTHKPTPRKLEKARERGQVARTRELGPALAFLGVALAAGALGSRALRGPFAWLPGSVPGAATTTIGVDEVWSLAGSLALASLPLVVVPLGSAALGAGLALVLQGGLQVAPGALRLDWSRIDPTSKLRSLLTLSRGWDLLRGLLAALATVWIVRATLLRLADGLAPLTLAPPAAAASRVGEVLVGLAWRVGLALAAVAALDLLVSRYLYLRSLRMSRQELKEEHHEQEGRPEVKQRRRRRLLELLRSRSLAGVRRADVVVTNPTHYAVALAYHPATMAAPRLLAKGRDRQAARLRLEALRHGVPIVENPPLARELYRKVEVDREIPPELYRAVAEVIAFVLRLGQGLAGATREALGETP